MVKLFQNEENMDDTTTVIGYVKFDLERDGLWFEHSQYKQMLEESVSHFEKGDFNPGRYFLAHPDQNISRITADILEDRYELSKVHLKQFGENVKKEDTPLAEEKNLAVFVPRVVTELKNAHVSLKIKELRDMMLKKHSEGDNDGVISVMQQIKQLEEIKKALAKVLGERIVLRW